MSTSIASHAQQPRDSDHWPGHEELIKEIEGQIHIPAKAMSITWGNNPNFWRWTELDSKDQGKFGFDTAAELHQVSWLEVKATIDLAEHSLFTSSHHDKEYEVVYHIKFKGDAFGWRDLPVTFVVVTPKGGTPKVIPNLESYGKRNEWIEIVGGEFRLRADAAKKELVMVEVTSPKWKGVTPNGGTPKVPNLESYGKRNEWIEIVGGEFRLPADAAKIELGMVEVTSAKWKGGLVLAGVTIRPHKSAGKDPMSSHA